MKNILCGFVWCRGKKDFEVFETNISKEDREIIEEILMKYDTTGTSVSNCWDLKFSDAFNDEY